MTRTRQVEMFDDQQYVNPKDAIWLNVPSSHPPPPQQFCSICGEEWDNLLMMGDEEVCESGKCEEQATAKQREIDKQEAADSGEEEQ